MNTSCAYLGFVANAAVLELHGAAALESLDLAIFDRKKEFGEIPLFYCILYDIWTPVMVLVRYID